MNKEDFLAAATAAAREVSRASNLPVGITVSQAALESAWGSSELSTSAFNFFGIKARAGRDWIEMRTQECRRGMAVYARARFAKYSSMQECFEDRDRMILQLPIYAEARSVAANPEEFIRALARHWATDPQYAEKILHVYHTNGLDALDNAPAEVP